jgi:hypothetical protein
MLPAASSKDLLFLASRTKWHYMTQRAMSARPYQRRRTTRTVGRCSLTL